MNPLKALRPLHASLLATLLTPFLACSPGSNVPGSPQQTQIPMNRSDHAGGPQTGIQNPRSQTPIVFAGLSNSSPKFIDWGPLKGTGWVEFETRPILKGMKQDGFSIQVEYMTPARIEHEFRVKNPICTYPVEWMNPEELFSSKPDRIYSIPLDIGGETTSYIIFPNDQLKKFKHHIDSKQNIDILSLLKDQTLKTQLIRDKDYGPLSATMTTRDASGDQIPRKTFEKNISLRVLSANQQTLEMLNAGRFDYAFYSDIEAEDFTRSKLNPKAFALLPFQTGRIKTVEDPSLVRVSIACSDTALTREAMPYLNQWIRNLRGLTTKAEVYHYRASIDPKGSQTQNMIFTTLQRFRESFESGALDVWYGLQAKHFSELNLYPKKPEGVTQTAPALATQKKTTPRWHSVEANDPRHESLILINGSTGLYTQSLFPYDDIENTLCQIPLDSSVSPYLTPQELSAIDAVSPLKGAETLAFLKDRKPGGLKKLTLFGDLPPEDLDALKPLLSGLLELRAFGASAPTTEALVQLLPPSLKHLNLFGSVVSSSELVAKVKQMHLLSLHLNHTSLTPEQLKEILPSLGSIEHLSLGLLRTTWNDEGAALFARQSFKNLKSLDLQNSALSDPQVLQILNSLPHTLESLHLGGNYLTSRGFSPIFERSFSSLKNLNLNYSIFGFPKTQSVRRFPASLQHLFLRNSGLSDVTLKQVELPKGLISLDLAVNQLQDPSLELILKSLPPEAKFLDLGKNAFSEKSLRQLIGFLEGRSIQTLRLPYLRISDGLIKDLFAKPLMELEDLDLSINQISSQGARLLARGMGPALRRLNLASNPIGREGLLEIAKHFGPNLSVLNLSNLLDLPMLEVAPLLPQSLKILSLSNNQLSDQEVQVLALHLPQDLRSLRLDRSAFSAVGAQALAQSIPNALEQLDLTRTPIGEPGTLAIVQALPHSTRAISIGGVALSTEASRAFRKALPKALRSLWLQPMGLTPEGLVDLCQNLPPRLEQLRLYAAPEVQLKQNASLAWPKSLLEIYLQGIVSVNPEATLNWMNQLPTRLTRLSLMGFGLDEGALVAVSQRSLKALHTLQISRGRFSFPSVILALKASGFVRATHLLDIQTDRQTSRAHPGLPFTPEVLGSQRMFGLFQIPLPDQKLREILTSLPADLWNLNLTENQIQLDQLERLIRLLPMHLRTLRINSNNLGGKGFERLEEYRKKREEKDGIPFAMQL